MLTRRYLTPKPTHRKGDIVSVFGWYDKQEWVRVKLIKLTKRGWLVVPVEDNAKTPR